MRIQLPGEFLKRPRAFLFLLYSLGVFGVGSDPVMYLPVNRLPPDLDCMPRGMATGAIAPATVPDSGKNSLRRMVYVHFTIDNACRAVLYSHVTSFKACTFGI